MSELFEVRDLDGWTPPQDRDVWFGVNPVARHVAFGRGTEADIVRVRTLFADLDVKPGKQFDGLWQCYDAARLLRERLEVWPVALIRSGHGLQPVWRIASPTGDSNVIDRARSREEWKALYARWGGMVETAARDAMWSPDGAEQSRSIDNVFELARVLRCPGSVNWKNPDKPVPVQTRLLRCAGRVHARDLVQLLDDNNIEPLAPVRAVAPRVATSWAQADAWIAEQPGAELDLAGLCQLTRSRVLWEYLDPARLVCVLNDPGGAHRAMTAKVLHAVLSAQEGRAGLVVALNNLQDAYLAVMEARERGELPGEARSAATAVDDVYRAVVGAVARARARGQGGVARVDGWGPGELADEPGPVPALRGWRWPRQPRRPRMERRA
ncbi:hypothetical protein PUR22_07620 [Mycolicibacterium porcinum]|uniref:hypothetical protein n=1 Tax=Mycolicibacterium porcinum TaxID=39693 RepID=UPI0031F856F0